jgi:hypothetical protein
MVLDSTDVIDDSDNESHINLAFFMLDTPTVDVIITTRYAEAGEMTTQDIHLFQVLIFVCGSCPALRPSPSVCVPCYTASPYPAFPPSHSLGLSLCE